MGTASVHNEFKKSDLIVVGQVIGKTETTIWLDTSFARSIFKQDYLRDHPNGNYDSFKHQTYAIKQLDFLVTVNKKYKGDIKRRTVKIRTGYGNGDCGYRFFMGQQYLIYAVEESSIEYGTKRVAYSKKDLAGIYRTSTCHRTRFFDEAAEDIKFLSAQK